MSRCWAVLAGCVLAAVAAASQGAVPVVDAVRTRAWEATAQIVVELSSPASYRFGQSERGTIAVDIPEARFSGAGFEPADLARSPVRKVRALRTNAGVRILIEMREDASGSAFALGDPPRLVIDVKRRGAPPPRTATGRSGDSAAARREAAQPGSSEVAAVPPPRRWPEIRSPAAEDERAGRANRRQEDVAAPRKTPPDLTAAPPESERQRSPRLKVVIDPGHGGSDPGAIGVDGLEEKKVTLAIASALAARARAAGGFDVVMTRTTDVFVPLEERTARANAEEADLFVSIHANASPNPDASGLETYYLDTTTDRATLRLAGMENGFAAATGRAAGESEVSYILSDMVQSYKATEAVDLASDVQIAAVAQIRGNGTPIRDLGVKRGPFFVLVGAAMPSVLVEVSFLTHPEEGRHLADPGYQNALAAGILRGLQRFVENSRNAVTL